MRLITDKSTLLVTYYTAPLGFAICWPDAPSPIVNGLDVEQLQLQLSILQLTGCTITYSDHAVEVLAGQGLTPTALQRDADACHCDDCGELIDNAAEGCTSPACSL